MQPQSFKNDVVGGAQIALPASPSVNSQHDYLRRSGGIKVTKTITINGDDETADVDCFILTGSVEVLAIYGEIATATVLNSCTDVNFNLNDATATVQLTKATDPVLSDLAVGTMFVKNAAAASALAVADNVAGALTETAAGVGPFQPFVITKKTGATTKVRLTYTTAGDAQDATFTITAVYIPLSSDGALVAA